MKEEEKKKKEKKNKKRKKETRKELATDKNKSIYKTQRFNCILSLLQ